MSSVSFTERRFVVDGLTIAAKLWGDDSGIPVIALHGWMDNAASFDALASHLPHLHILAIDLPGHGFSDHKPPSGNYAIWDDLRCIIAVAGQMDWQKFCLMGHSRGAIIAGLLGAAFPDRVSHLFCIDGLIPEPEAPGHFPAQLAKYISDFSADSSLGDKGHTSFDSAVAARCRATPMTEEAARAIVERGSYQAENGRYYWRSDKRLKYASPVKLILPQIQASLDAITAPAILVSASEGLGKWLRSFDIKIDHCFALREIEGHHHCHMETQSKQIAEWFEELLAGRETSRLTK
ncbi:alpha/beta fold hydrolase [Zhongshania sp. BJYM1]|uniref:alpha/beta fold hydrolase n=1 Tax=Zhongshania aquatica TaxID=2965069 RepID=UPI0022B50BA8|nr:alpha/beta hydrolase [Marortus sp. BJYM1]